MTDNNATLPSTHVPDGADVNQHLDALAVRDEPADYEAAWWQRRKLATLYTTVRTWLLRQ
jgi:hypothetical protein